jgi:hypothetical protein
MSCAMKVVAVQRPTLAPRMAAKPRRASSVVVYSAPDKAQIESAIKEAEEACDGGEAGEW